MTDEPNARAIAAADQLAAAVARTQPHMIGMAHLYLMQGTDRTAALAKLYRHLLTSHRVTGIIGLYAGALLRLAEAEGRAALAGGQPPPPPAA